MHGVGGLEAVVIDCADPESLAGFWAAMFGTEIDAEIGHEVGYAFRAVADPEGNEFCLVRQDAS